MKYFNETAIKNLILTNDDFCMDLKKIFGRISILNTMQSRTSEYTMSPDRVIERRQKELKTLNCLVRDIFRLNKKYGGNILGLVRNSDKVNVQWDVTDELYEVVVMLINDPAVEMKLLVA